MTSKLSPDQARVLGALIEKSATTPDNYPLSANALRLACNQTTNRDPVVTYDQRAVDTAMIELRQMGLARTVHQSGSRVPKHRHTVEEAYELAPDELAVVAVLLLRGPQTVAELAARTARYGIGPAGPDAVEAIIDQLAARDEPLVVRLGRRLGEREPRVDQLLIDADLADPAVGGTHGPPPELAAGSDATTVRRAAPVEAHPLGDSAASLSTRVEALERALAEQTARIDRLAEALGDW